MSDQPGETLRALAIQVRVDPQNAEASHRLAVLTGASLAELEQQLAEARRVAAEIAETERLARRLAIERAERAEKALAEAEKARDELVDEVADERLRAIRAEKALAEIKRRWREAEHALTQIGGVLADVQTEKGTT